VFAARWLFCSGGRFLVVFARHEVQRWRLECDSHHSSLRLIGLLMQATAQADERRRRLGQ
jgi:hypothetical protein